MSFNLYFAGSQAKQVDEYIKKVGGARLFSFADKSKKGFDDFRLNAPNSKLFMDSGAFSVFHSGAVINIDEHLQFINDTEGVEVWAQLDDIPYPVLNAQTAKDSSEGSWKKYLYGMSKLKEERKDSFIPIYHYGEPYEALERMLNTEVDGRLAPYIGIGGRHGVSTASHKLYFDYIFDIIKKSKNPNVKVHAFGMTILSLLEQYPFYSADSTTWLMLGVNGNIQTRSAGTVLVSSRQKGDKNNICHYPPHLKAKIQEELDQLGYTIEEVASDYKKRLIFNVKYFKDWADNYEYKPVKCTTRKKRLF